MKLVLQCPTDDFKGEAEAAWSAFLERVPKPPIQVTEVQFETSKEPLTGAIAEVPPWSRPTIRLSERFFGLESSLQTVTLLHETIHHSLLLDKTSQRMDRVQEWSKPYTYLRASSSEERHQRSRSHVDARATRCPAVPPKKIGGAAGFVQTHEVGDIPGRRRRVPRDPRGRDVRPIVFGRADRFF